MVMTESQRKGAMFRSFAAGSTELVGGIVSIASLANKLPSLMEHNTVPNSVWGTVVMTGALLGLSALNLVRFNSLSKGKGEEFATPIHKAVYTAARRIIA